MHDDVRLRPLRCVVACRTGKTAGPSAAQAAPPNIVHVCVSTPPAALPAQAVLLGQLDGVRRELVEVVGRWAPHIMFGKELVREVLAFAQVRALAAMWW